MVTDFCEEYIELSLWAKEELRTGSRVKASKIRKVADRLKERREEYQEYIAKQERWFLS